jgi:hypothetical protein
MLKKIKFEFNGPCKFIKKTKEFKKLNMQDIIHVCIKTGRKIKEVRENKITYSLHKNNLFIYHSFNDIDYSGRWYNINFPKENILNIKNNILEVKINEWENIETGKLTKATIIIEFSEKAVKKMLTTKPKN